MKQKLLNKLWLRVGMIVAIMTTALSGTVWAAEEVFKFSELGYSNGADVTTVEGDEITLTFAQGTGQNAPKYYTTGSGVRMYTNNTLDITLKGESEKKITAIDFTFSGTNTGSLEDWSGSEASVSFTNTASGQARIQEIAITISAGGDTPVTYTVTYNANGATSGSVPTDNNSYSANATVTVLGNTGSLAKTDYTFDGWNTAANGSGTAYAAGATFTINANTTLYAQWEEQASGDEQWVLTSLSDLTSSDVFVIVGNGYAMTNNNGTSSAPATSAVTITGSTITSTVNANIKWNVSGNATDGYTFYPNGTTTTWLYCNTTASSSSNNNMRVGTGDRKVFKLNSNNYLITNDTYTTRYLSIYDNANWRGYTSTSNGAVALSFYKKVTGGVIPPSITASTNEIAYNETSGSITYFVTNPVEGGVVTATSSGNWLTIGAISDGTIALTCAANSETTSRTATVTLTYTYGEGETVTTTVNVTQAAAPVIYTTIPALFSAATTTAKEAKVTFNNWVVSGVSTNGKDVFVTDNNGNGFVIFDNDGNLGQVYAVGDILSGTAVACNLVLYNGFAELTGLAANDLTITKGGSVTASNITLANLSGVNTGALVSYSNLTCSVDDSGNTTKYYLSDGTTTLQVYNALYAFDALEDGKTYNITGIYQQFNSTKEILPRSAADIEEYVDNRTAVATIGDDLTPTTINIDDIDDFSLTITPASGLTEGTDYIVVWETSDASILELADETYEAKAVGSVTVTVTVTPDDDTTYKEVSKAFTVNVIDPNVKGTEANPYTVAEVIAMNPGTTAVKTDVYVKGYIVGCYHNNNFTNDVSNYEESNLALSDSPTETSSVIPVQLTNNTTPRTEFNIVSKPYNVGVAQVVVKADVIKYFSVPGLKNTETITKVAEYVKVTSAGYATYYTDCALDFTGTDITAYAGTLEGTKLTFAPHPAVPAEQGVLLVANGAKNVTVPVTTAAVSISNNCMAGTLEGTTLSANDYILNKINDGVGFYKAGSWTTLGAHKAYIPAAVGNGVKGFTIDFDDDATGISLMEDGRSQMEDGVIYNLAGQRISKMQKGINIVNGKKIAVK